MRREAVAERGRAGALPRWEAVGAGKRWARCRRAHLPGTTAVAPPPGGMSKIATKTCRGPTIPFNHTFGFLTMW